MDTSLSNKGGTRVEFRLSKEDKELFLHADQELPYGVVVEVMAAAKKGGAESLAMVTDPVAKPPREKKRRRK